MLMLEYADLLRRAAQAVPRLAMVVVLAAIVLTR